MPKFESAYDGPGLLFVLVALVVVAVTGARLFGFAPQVAQRTGDVLVMQERGAAPAEPAAADGRPSQRVVILHAHATENYRPNPPHTRGGAPGDVVKVGAELAAALEERGFQVEHLTQAFDHPHWSEAFPRAGEAITKVLAQYNDVVAVIDIHRDAIAGDAGPEVTTATVNGQQAARVLLVVGEANNPNARANAAFAEAVKAQLESQAPQLLRGIRVHTSNYNGHLHPNTVQLFVGDYERNTLEQARAAMRVLAPSLAEALRKR